MYATRSTNPAPARRVALRPTPVTSSADLAASRCRRIARGVWRLASASVAAVHLLFDQLIHGLRRGRAVGDQTQHSTQSTGSPRWHDQRPVFRGEQSRHALKAPGTPDHRPQSGGANRCSGQPCYPNDRVDAVGLCPRGGTPMAVTSLCTVPALLAGDTEAPPRECSYRGSATYVQGTRAKYRPANPQIGRATSTARYRELGPVSVVRQEGEDGREPGSG